MKGNKSKTKMKIKTIPKPIPKKLWDDYYSEILVDNIMFFQNAVDFEDKDDWDNIFLMGMLKGMWLIYEFIQERMVDD
jgi:hypothetical protein